MYNIQEFIQAFAVVVQNVDNNHNISTCTYYMYYRADIQILWRTLDKVKCKCTSTCRTSIT